VLANLPVGLLVRLRAGRCYYWDPDPTQVAATRRPRRHGAKITCADPTSWGAPSAQFEEPTTAYGAVHMQSWDQVHAQLQNHQQRGTRRPRPPDSGYLDLARSRVLAETNAASRTDVAVVAGSRTS
jgi:hypothetical protein